MTHTQDTTLSFDNADIAKALFGVQNAHLAQLANISTLRLATRGASVTILGEEKARLRMANLLSQLYGVLQSGTPLTLQDIERAYTTLEKAPTINLQSLFQDAVFVASPKKTIVPKTPNQRAYVMALRTVDMTLAVGPAGTGKTYLAVAMALSMLLSKKVKRIILARPAVEAGEKLGFLPGDMAQKVNPYLRPLYDALHDMLDAERVTQMMETGIIEIAPLAFMRGRTLNDAFVILDEAQNTTIEQMKMFVTRMGFGSHMAITGDITQIDLPQDNGKTRSGLVHALGILKNIEGIHTQFFTEEDVIRHPLVGRIIRAYDQPTKTHS